MNDENKELTEIIANLIVMTTVGAQAHPEAKEIITAMQDSIIAVIAITKGPEWLKENDNTISALLKERVSELKNTSIN